MPNHNLPYTLEMYKQQLQKMMMNPMATGQAPQQAGTSLLDRMRMAAGKMASTSLAGSAM